jgi:hypothetical protein
MKTPSEPLGAGRKQFTASKIDENVWQQVLKIAEKNEDFKRRLRALGLLDRKQQSIQEESTIEEVDTVPSSR